MEDTAMQHSFTFIILDKIILQNKKNARWRSRKMWQVKEMEEVYGYDVVRQINRCPKLQIKTDFLEPAIA